MIRGNFFIEKIYFGFGERELQAVQLSSFFSFYSINDNKWMIQVLSNNLQTHSNYNLHLVSASAMEYFHPGIFLS